MINSFFVKSGKKPLMISFLLLILGFAFDFFYALFAAVFIFCCLLYLRRLPKKAASDELGIYAPVAGRVKAVELAWFRDEKCLRVVITKGLFSGSVLMPFDAKFTQLKYKNGLFLCPFMKNAQLLNQRALFVFQKDKSLLAIRLMAGALSLGLQADEPPKNISTKDELGFMADGLVELFLPLNSRLSVSVGERVAKASLIGYFDLKDKR